MRRKEWYKERKDIKKLVKQQTRNKSMMKVVFILELQMSVFQFILSHAIKHLCIVVWQ